MRLVAYLRVSTDVQAEKGVGLDVQRAGIKSWAKSAGHKVVAWFEDAGVSGTCPAGENGEAMRRAVAARVGLHNALAALKDGEADGLVVYRLDRLARTLTIQESTLGAVWGMGKAAFSVDLGEVPQDDPDDPMRTALRQMVGVFSQLERGMINARLRAGRRRKAEDPALNVYGSPAFGMRTTVEPGRWAPDPEEAPALARIAQLHGEGRSLREIARTLDAEGYPPKQAASRAAKHGSPSRWHPETVKRIVARLGPS